MARGLIDRALRMGESRQFREHEKRVESINRIEPEMDVREMLWLCKTLTPSLMSGDEAKKRLKEINVHVYRCLNELGVNFPAESSSPKVSVGGD